MELINYFWEKNRNIRLLLDVFFSRIDLTLYDKGASENSKSPSGRFAKRLRLLRAAAA